MSFGFRTLYILTVGVTVLAVALFVIASNRLVEKYADDQKQQFLEQSFAAIAAGPLTLARLHAGEIAQSQLQNWFTHVAGSGFELNSVTISGGQGNQYIFAKVSSERSVAKNCLQAKVREYSFPDSLNSLLVTLEVNDCAIPASLSLFRTEVQIILGGAAILLAIGFTILLFPVLQSIRQGSRIVVDVDSSRPTLVQIPFVPVRELVAKARQASNEKTSLALIKSSRQLLHDIKSPIGAILAVAQHIGSKSENEPAVKLLESASARLEAISKNVISEFTNISAVGVRELYSIVLGISKEQELRTGRGIVLAVLDPDLTQVNVRCDRVLFGRVVSNLLSNAIEALPERNGTVTLRFEKSNEFLIINVIDNGHGMSGETLELIRKGSLTTKISGSGLGISSAMELMKAWGSSLDIQTELGSGTVVSLKFPIVN